MKKLISVIALSLVTTLFLSAFAQEGVKYFERDFTKIDISSAFKAEITQGSSYRIEVFASEDDRDHVIIKKDGDELEISIKGMKSIKGEIMVKIQLPELNELEISGAASVTLGDFQGESLNLELSGASSLQGGLSYNSLRLESSGASSVKLDGTTNSAKIYMSGASSLGTEGFKVKGELLLDCSGASKATLMADGDIYLELSGASQFHYSGVGNILKQDLSGASSVKKKGE
ncbi:MAG: DUF2807 domain-containing protein [Vicingaceae bacterium]